MRTSTARPASNHPVTPPPPSGPPCPSAFAPVPAAPLPRRVAGTSSLAIGAFVVMFLLPPLGMLLGVLAGRRIRRRGLAGAGFARISVIGGGVLTVLYPLAAMAAMTLWYRIGTAFGYDQPPLPWR